MKEYLRSSKSLRSKVMGAWRPPPRLSLSEWAAENFYLSAGDAGHGRWHAYPYQRGMMDAITDPKIEQVWVIKSARVGYTKMLNAAIGYWIHQAPCPVMLIQPTVEDAKGYSKEEIAPMLRDCPALARIVFEEADDTGPKDSGNTILHKRFPGGVLSLGGANSGTAFRRISRKAVLFDEVDAYPPSAGSDGDQIKLGIKRSETFHDRKIVGGSTPLVAGRSRIEGLFHSGDQRRFYVPCPSCGHMDFLSFRERNDERGHWMAWPDGRPGEAHFVCRANGCVIEHAQKRWMVERGEWRAETPPKVLPNGRLVASFHIWAAYSFSPNASWGQIATEFTEAKGDTEKLRTVINTLLGETWQEQGEAPDWERLFQRREISAQVADAVRFLTCGVDVQKDRVVYEVVGWGDGKQSWSVEAGVIPMDTANDADWTKVDELLERSWPKANGVELAILRLAVDSGYNTQIVYNWARRKPERVLAVKGSHTQRTIIGTPTPVDVTHRGQKIARGCKVWTVGVSVAKGELYGWLRSRDPSAPGFCHFSENNGEDYFKQLTGEQLVTNVNKRTRQPTTEWQVLPGRENHYLDARVYARAAAAVCGLDRMRAKQAAPHVTPPEVVAAIARADARRDDPPHVPEPKRPRGPSDSRFQLSRPRGKPWLKR